MDTIRITDTGCFLDNHRGHYISRDVIELAVGWGFIIGPFEQFAVDMYDNTGTDIEHADKYPHEALMELADEACNWLNSGTGDCETCNGKGQVIFANGYVICKACSGSGRGNRMPGQNFPPHIPAGYAWDFFDGDFGLYSIEDDLSA